MSDQLRSKQRVQWPPLLRDPYGEDRHDLVERLAYQYWTLRGSPLGSPDTDWFTAEKAMRAYLLAAGIVLGPHGDLYRMDNG